MKMHEYLFDVKLFAAIRVKARTEDEARKLIFDHIDAADCNFGSWPNGDPITGEASIDDSEIQEMPCVEIDGEAL